MKCPHSPDDAAEDESTGNGKSETSRQREVTKPSDRYRRIAPTKFSAIERLDCKYRVADTHFREPCEGFGDKATTGVVVP